MQVAGVVLIVAGVVVGALLWLAAGRRYDDAVADLAPVPLGCTTTLSFDRTGTYTFFVETKGEIGEIDGDCVTDDRAYDVDAGDVPRVSLELIDERGDEVDLDRTAGPSYDRAGRRGVGVRTRRDRRVRRLRADRDRHVRRRRGRRAGGPRPGERRRGAPGRRCHRPRARRRRRRRAARARAPPSATGSRRARSPTVADRPVPDDTAARPADGEPDGATAVHAATCVPRAVPATAAAGATSRSPSGARRADGRATRCRRRAHRAERRQSRRITVTTLP